MLIPWEALLRGVIGRGERLVVGMLEQPLVQPLGVTGQVVGEHVECSAQWQRPLTHVHIQDCFADICSGDVEHTGLFAPDPRVVTVVPPPVNDTCFHSLVVTEVGVRDTTVTQVSGDFAWSPTSASAMSKTGGERHPSRC